MNIDDEFKELSKKRSSNWPRLISLLKKHIDNWALREIKPFWGHMKISYMPVICNIELEGSTANEISKNSLTAKQAMSRTLHELQDSGMIYSTQSKNDKRKERLNLTDTGKKFLLDANLKVDELIEDYKNLVGEEDLITTVKVINKIIAFHEELEKNNLEES
ncbi:MAG: hypothetical protein CMO01_25760 [Thalassobius sp.]|nr:hypothetical protein [Thalassovita sp.]